MLILVIVSSLSCSTIQDIPNLVKIVKISPEYEGIDPAFQNYYNNYVSLAKLNGIAFEGKVTIGFKVLDYGDGTVGLCTINGVMGFREIDIDKEYWDNTMDEKKLFMTLRVL